MEPERLMIPKGFLIKNRDQHAKFQDVLIQYNATAITWQSHKNTYVEEWNKTEGQWISAHNLSHLIFDRSPNRIANCSSNSGNLSLQKAKK